MKRSLACTMASAIRRGFKPIQNRVELHSKGMEAIEEQVRSTSQNNWIMIDYEDFLTRPLAYAPVLADWWRVDNVSAFMTMFEEIKVRDPERNVLEESWQRIGEFDEKSSKNKLKEQLTMEEKVRNMVHKWAENEQSIWNNDCVLVSPENTRFIENGYECF